MSNARMGRIAPRTGHADSTRTSDAKRDSIARKQARTLKGWAPVPFDPARIEADLDATAVRA